MRHKKKMEGGNAKTDKGDIFYPSLKTKQNRDTLWIPSWFPAAVSVFQLGCVRFDTQAQNWRGIWMQGHAKGLYIQQESCRGVWVQGVVVFFFFFPEQAIAYSIHNQAASYILFTKIIFLPRWRTGWRRRATGSWGVKLLAGFSLQCWVIVLWAGGGGGGEGGTMILSPCAVGSKWSNTVACRKRKSVTLLPGWPSDWLARLRKDPQLSQLLLCR